jgi:hypothetical protein
MNKIDLMNALVDAAEDAYFAGELNVDCTDDEALDAISALRKYIDEQPEVLAAIDELNDLTKRT